MSAEFKCLVLDTFEVERSIFVLKRQILALIESKRLTLVTLLSCIGGASCKNNYISLVASATFIDILVLSSHFSA